MMKKLSERKKREKQEPEVEEEEVEVKKNRINNDESQQWQGTSFHGSFGQSPISIYS